MKLKLFTNIFFLWLLFASSSSFAALEIVVIEFKEEFWQDPNIKNGVKWYYGERNNIVFDLKELINDVDNPDSPIRSYILEYNKGITQYQRLNYTGKIDLSNATLDALEIRARGKESTQFDLYFACNNVGNVLIPNPMQGFGGGFRSAVIGDINGNHNNKWLLKLSGEAQMNALILNVLTNGENCLKNLCK